MSNDHIVLCDTGFVRQFKIPGQMTTQTKSKTKNQAKIKAVKGDKREQFLFGTCQAVNTETADSNLIKLKYM